MKRFDSIQLKINLYYYLQNSVFSFILFPSVYKMCVLLIMKEDSKYDSSFLLWLTKKPLGTCQVWNKQLKRLLIYLTWKRFMVPMFVFWRNIFLTNFWKQFCINFVINLFRLRALNYHNVLLLIDIWPQRSIYWQG